MTPGTSARKTTPAVARSGAARTAPAIATAPGASAIAAPRAAIVVTGTAPYRPVQGRRKIEWIALTTAAPTDREGVAAELGPAAAVSAAKTDHRDPGDGGEDDHPDRRRRDEEAGRARRHRALPEGEKDAVGAEPRHAEERCTGE